MCSSNVRAEEECAIRSPSTASPARSQGTHVTETGHEIVILGIEIWGLGGGRGGLGRSRGRRCPGGNRPGKQSEPGAGDRLGLGLGRGGPRSLHEQARRHHACDRLVLVRPRQRDHRRLALDDSLGGGLCVPGRATWRRAGGRWQGRGHAGRARHTRRLGKGGWLAAGRYLRSRKGRQTRRRPGRGRKNGRVGHGAPDGVPGRGPWRGWQDRYPGWWWAEDAHRHPRRRRRRQHGRRAGRKGRRVGERDILQHQLWLGHSRCRRIPGRGHPTLSFAGRGQAQRIELGVVVHRVLRSSLLVWGRLAARLCLLMRQTWFRSRCK